MTNRQVIEAFLSGAVEARHGTMSLRKTPGGIALYSYEEVIALAVRNGQHKLIYTNDHSYSLTTTAQQGQLRSALAFLARTDGYEPVWPGRLHRHGHHVERGPDFKLPYELFERKVSRAELRELCGLDPDEAPTVKRAARQTIDARTGQSLHRGGGW